VTDESADSSADAASKRKQPWTLLDRNELVEAYWNRVAPAMRADGLDPETDRPTHEWLSAHGFRGLIYALREYHDRTFGEFWAEDLGLDAGDDDYDWATDHDQTIDFLEAYVDSRHDRGELRDSSADTLRYRLGRYVRAYCAANGTSDLLAPVARNADVPAYEATDAAWAAFDRLDDELAPRTMRRIHEVVDDWYAHLIRRKRAGVNPVAGLDDEYRWTRRVGGAGEDPVNPALDPAQVRALYETAARLEERLLIIALCAWGLRSGEVAALHRSQLVLNPADAEVPYVQFQTRKNGPGRVSILYGRETLNRRLDEFDDRASWNGYLFPSSRSASGHLTRQTILNRFEDLADRTDLPGDTDSETVVPQMARRFWYDAYSTTQEAILEEVGEIAAEQGSASPEVVLREYLSPERRRRLRREYMREALADALPGDSL
jgi:site-specific recombinase XerD